MTDTPEQATPASASDTAGTGTPSSASALPRFYKAPAALSAERHGGAGLGPQQGYGFARHTNALLLTVAEIGVASRHYAIAFSSGAQPLPLAVLGLSSDNAFVGDDGRWLEDAYVPAYVRRYPFIFFADETSDRLVLCVDEGADNFEAQSQQPFFVDGKPSEGVREVLRFCENYQAQHAETQRFGQWLAEHDLLENRVARVELEDGRVFTLDGFRIIDPQKFRALADDKVLELHRRGWLGLVHFHLQSLSNLAVLSRLAARQASVAAAA